jgi:hypothetical protein
MFVATTFGMTPIDLFSCRVTKPGKVDLLDLDFTQSKIDDPTIGRHPVSRSIPRSFPALHFDSLRSRISFLP